MKMQNNHNKQVRNRTKALLVVYFLIALLAVFILARPLEAQSFVTDLQRTQCIVSTDAHNENFQINCFS